MSERKFEIGDVVTWGSIRGVVVHYYRTGLYMKNGLDYKIGYILFFRRHDGSWVSQCCDHSEWCKWKRIGNVVEVIKDLCRPGPGARVTCTTYVEKDGIVQHYTLKHADDINQRLFNKEDIMTLTCNNGLMICDDVAQVFTNTEDALLVTKWFGKDLTTAMLLVIQSLRLEKTFADKAKKLEATTNKEAS